MNGVYGRYLRETFPKLYKNPLSLEAKEPFSMRGFEVDDGWFAIIEEMSQALDALNIHVEDFWISQVKEKFGGLRVYIDVTSRVSESVQQQIRDIIQRAKGKADVTCELTGEPGVLCKRQGHFLTVGQWAQEKFGYSPVDGEPQVKTVGIRRTEEGKGWIR